MSRIVIVGGGQAAGQAAATLRQKKYDGDITIVCNEPHLPYQRPPLSKQYLAGETALNHLLLRQVAFYEDRNIKVRRGETVTHIDVSGQQVATDAGDSLTYDKLLLATGAKPHALEVPGISLRGIHYLRTIADVDRIREEMSPGTRLCIVGGGYIGLEVAAIAVSGGMQVTVLEAGQRVMQRVATPQLSEFYAALHRRHGVDIRENAGVTGFAGDTAVREVHYADAAVDTDLVIVGIGVEPNVGLARDAGLACDDGIVVDERCQTSDTNIYAAGDCTNHPNPILQRRLRLESVPNALDQGKVAAANMLGGDEVHDAVPWFWSDQYGLKLQMVGLASDGDELVVRGDMASEKFAIFHMRDNRIVAVDAVNEPKAFMAGKRLFGKRVDPAKLADASVDTRTLLR